VIAVLVVIGNILEPLRKMVGIILDVMNVASIGRS